MSYLDVLKAYKSQLGGYEAEQSEQQSRLETALQTLTARAGGEHTIPRQARKAFRERDVQMASLKGEQRERQEALGTARADIRAEHTQQPGEAGYVNPYRVEALIRAAEEGRRREISSYGDIIQQRHGTQQEAVGDVLAAYQAGTARAQAEVGARQSMLDYATQRLGAETNLVQNAYQQGYREEQDKLQRELMKLAEERRQYEWGEARDTTQAATDWERQVYEQEWPYRRAVLQKQATPSTTSVDMLQLLQKQQGAGVLADYARQLQEASQRAPSKLAQIWGIGPSVQSYEDVANRLRSELAGQYPGGLGEFAKYYERYKPEGVLEDTPDRPYFDLP